MDELGVGGEIQKSIGLRQQQYRRRREQHRARQRDDGADRASLAGVLVGIVVGRGLTSGLIDGSGAIGRQ